jgi:hypothetical protein
LARGWLEPVAKIGLFVLVLLLVLETLVYRLLNPLGFAAGQLAVFQGASDEHIWIDT